MIRKTPILFFLALGLLLGGCGNKEAANEKAAKPESPVATNDQPSATTEESPQAPAGEGDGQKPEAAAPPGTATDPKSAPSDNLPPGLIKNPAGAPVRKTEIKPPTTGDPGWKNSSMDPEEFANRLGTSLGSLKGVLANAEAIVTTPMGEGRFLSEIAIKDQRAYKIDYFVVDGMPYSASLVSNGTKRSARIRDRWIKPLSTTTPFTEAPSQELRGDDGVKLRVPTLTTGDQASYAWHTEFTRLLFQGLTEGQDAIKPALQGLQKDAEVFVQERQTPYEGKTYLNYRLLVVEKGAKTESQEIIVDSEKFLPITIRTTWTDKKNKPYSVLWMCSWKNGTPDAKKFTGPF